MNRSKKGGETTLKKSNLQSNHPKSFIKSKKHRRIVALHLNHLKTVAKSDRKVMKKK